MRARVLLCMPVLLMGLFALPVGQVSQAAGDVPQNGEIESVAERRILASMEEQRLKLKEKEEILKQRELELKTLEREVDKKLDELRKASEEAAALLQQKDEAESKRLRGLSAMYEKMPPEKAAALLAAMEESLAVDILAGMKNKTAGRVLGNMTKEKAVKLSRAFSKL